MTPTATSHADGPADLDGLRGAIVIVRSEVQALVGLIATVAAAAGIQQIDGLPVAEWYAHLRRAHIRQSLECLEGSGNPALAARLQAKIDRWEAGRG